MSEVKWIKFMVGTFDGRSFKKIKKAKIGGDSLRDKLTAVWFELLELAGKINDNGKLVENTELAFSSESQFEDIATMIDRDIDEVNLCITWYEQNGMIEIIDDVYSLANWCKYQSVERMDNIREYNRIKQQEHRARKKALELEQKQVVNDNVNDNFLTCQSSSYSYSIYNKDSNTNKKENINEYIKEIIDYLNKVGNKKYTYKNKTNNSYINARLEEGHTVEEFKKVIDTKWQQWKQTEMEKFFRPETLFSSAHFESYLNEFKEKTYDINDGWESLDDNGGFETL